MRAVTDMTRLLTRTAQSIEAVSEWTGRATAWLIPALVLLVGYDVAMRYLFQAGSVALQELEWHLFALIFLLGAAYTLRHDAHVRVDVFYHSRVMNERRRALVDLLGTIFLLLPFCALIIVSSASFVHDAWLFNEVSSDAGGLSHRFLLKAAIPAGFALLLLQGIAGICRCLLVLRSGRQEN